MKRTVPILAGILLMSIPSTFIAQAPPPAHTNMVAGYQIGGQDADSRTCSTGSAAPNEKVKYDGPTPLQAL